MNDKLQEYIDAISSERKGEDVRDAIIRAFLVVDTDNKQINNHTEHPAADKEYIRASLDAIWDAILEKYPNAKVNKALENPNGEDGVSNEDLLKRYLLETIKMSPDTSITPYNLAMLVPDLHRTWTTTQSLVLTQTVDTRWPTESGVPAPHDLAVFYVGNATHMQLKLYYNKRGCLINGGGILPSDSDDGDYPLVHLTTTAPLPYVHNGEEYWESLGDMTDSPDLAGAVTMQENILYEASADTGLIDVPLVTSKYLVICQWPSFRTIENASYGPLTDGVRNNVRVELTLWCDNFVHR